MPLDFRPRRALLLFLFVAVVAVVLGTVYRKMGRTRTVVPPTVFTKQEPPPISTPLAIAPASSPMDRPAIDALRQAVPALQQAVVIKRLSVNARLDLVLLIGWPRKIDLTPGNGYPWSPQDRIGLFLQDKSNPGVIAQLIIEPGPNNDCGAAVERMTVEELVLSCMGEKWATYANQEFLYDLDTKALVKRFSYLPFSTFQVLPGRNGPQFVMGNGQELLLAEVDPGTDAPRIAAGSEANSVLSRIPMQENARESGIIRTPAPQPDPASDFGPGNRFHLTKAKNQYGSDFPLIVERQNDGANSREQSYALPQSDVKTWLAARLDEAKGPIRPNPAEMNEQIGPHQIEENRLWFGKTFYNSEGLTGVGGFGYFDTATRSYELYAPAELLPWSVSAILVEPDSIWLALYRRGEYGNAPGGLIRWERSNQQVQQFVLPEVVTNLARCGDAICLGNYGVVVLKEGRTRSYFIDRTNAGTYQFTERTSASQ